MGFKPKDMAEKLGISASYYYKIEAGTRNPTLDLAERIKYLIGGSMDELFLDFSWANKKVRGKSEDK